MLRKYTSYVGVALSTSNNSASPLYTGSSLLKGKPDEKLFAVYDQNQRHIWCDCKSMDMVHFANEICHHGGLNRVDIRFGCGDISACPGVGTKQHPKILPMTNFVCSKSEVKCFVCYTTLFYYLK